MAKRIPRPKKKPKEKNKLVIKSRPAKAKPRKKEAPEQVEQQPRVEIIEASEAIERSLPPLPRPTLTADSMQVPGVYWFRGYLRLVFSKRSDRVTFLSCSDGEVLSDRVDEFLRTHRFNPEVSPNHLAVFMISRVVEGTFNSTLAIYRRLIEMSMSKEELMRMSERTFAIAYGRIMKSEKPVKRLKPNEKLVDELLAKLAEEGEVLNQPAVEEGAAPQGEAGAPSEVITNQPDDPKGIGMSKGKGKKKLTGAAAAKKNGSAEIAKRVVNVNRMKHNPFREGTMKHKCFERYKEGGERGAILAAMQKMGAKQATASSWFQTFGKVKAS